MPNNSNYKTMQQYYKLDITLHQNKPFGVMPFYKLGPKQYKLCPTTKHGFHKNIYKTHQNNISKLFNMNS